MAYNFRPYNPKQRFLMPLSLADWLPADHLARFVAEVVDHLHAEKRLVSFFSRYRADGHGGSAYHPVMMLKVLLYGYCVGVRSSRKIARALVEDVPFRFLAANQQPDFRSINRFRLEFREPLEALFVEVLQLCRQAGLAMMGRVALDGRKVAGNAALDQNRTKEAIKKEVQRILAEADVVDQQEDERYGPDRRGDELPEGLADPRSRLSRLKEAQRQLEAQEDAARRAQQDKLDERKRQEKKSGKKKGGRPPKSPGAAVSELAGAKANVTDPDSRSMKRRDRYVQGYNGQAMADCGSQVIVACDVTQDRNDVHQLELMLNRCEEQAGRLPGQTLADSGYASEANFVHDGEGTELLVAISNDRKRAKELGKQGPPRGRIAQNATRRERMARKLRTKRGRAAYGHRKTTIEPVFGQMEGRGLNRFWLRGLGKVRMEWSLWCTSHNLLKLWRELTQWESGERRELLAGATG